MGKGMGLSGNCEGNLVDQKAVISVTGDWLVDNLGAPDFIKVDIEGSEIMFLRGASNLFKKYRPIIYIEVSDYNRHQATEFFYAVNYVLLEVTSHELHRIELCVFNTLAIPAEKENDFRASW